MDRNFENNNKTSTPHVVDFDSGWLTFIPSRARLFLVTQDNYTRLAALEMRGGTGSRPYVVYDNYGIRTECCYSRLRLRAACACWCSHLRCAFR